VRKLHPPKRLRRERGATIVEMSLVLPVIVVLIGGMIDFGLVLSDMNQARHGARETARALAVADLSTAPTCAAEADITDGVVCFARDRVDNPDALVKIEFIGPYQHGSAIRVCVQHPMSSATGLAGRLLDGDWGQVHAEMRIEQTFDDLLEFEDVAPASTDWAWCA
jgi:ABC-type Na+ efflux pump permease subunit